MRGSSKMTWLKAPPKLVARFSEAMAALAGAEVRKMPGRPMREYLSLPDALIADPAALAPWLERALAGVLALPPKKGG